MDQNKSENLFKKCSEIMGNTNLGQEKLLSGGSRCNVYVEVKKFLEDIYVHLKSTGNPPSSYINDNDDDHDDEDADIPSTKCEQKLTKVNELIKRCEQLFELFERNQLIKYELDHQYLDMAINKMENLSEYVDLSTPPLPKQLPNDDQTTTTTTSNDLYDQCNYNKKNRNINAIEDLQKGNDDDDEDDVDYDDIKSCPFSGLPATHLQIKKCPKIGFLFRIEKRIFFNISKKFYAGLLNGWLILYNSQTDLKPTMCLQVSKLNFDLLNGGDQLLKRNSILQFSIGGKKYQFQATTLNETDDWINVIENELKNKNRSLPTLPLSLQSDAEPLSLLEEENQCNRNSEEIYEEPSEISNQMQQHQDEKLILILDYDVPKSPPRSINDNSILSSTILNATNRLPMQSTVEKFPKLPTANHQKSFSKNWLFNRLSRSTSASASASTKPIKTKLQNQEAYVKTPIISMGPSATSAAVGNHQSIKGIKVNMIINQLEANGSLSLLSKSMFAAEKQKSFLLNTSANINYDEHNYEPVCITPSKSH